MRKAQAGFTIVELLIVIVVIAILAAISVVAYNGIQERGRVSRASSDVATLNRAIQAGRVAQNKTLYQITGSNCTSCGVIPYATALDRISAASGANLESLKAGDPWGNPYYIDENEGENGNCTRDAIGVNPARTGIGTTYVPTYAC